MLNTRASFHEDMISVFDHVPTPEEYRRVQHLIIKKPMVPITDDELAKALKHCCNLQTVILSGLPELSDRSVVVLAENAIDLQGIDLTNCKDLTDVGIMELAAKSLPLEWMHLNGLQGITDAAISTVAKTCSRLAELELSDIPLLTPLSVRDVWSYSRKLRVLRIRNASNLTDKAFPAPIAGSASFSLSLEDKPLPHRPITWIEQIPPLILSHSADNLRVLDLSNCKKITDAAIRGIVMHATRIQNISLSGCQLTDSALESLCNLGNHLDVITLSHVSRITDRGVVSLASACTNLRVVDLSFCRLLTDMSVIELAGLTGLRRLSLVRVQKLTDNAIFFMAEHCPKIERLHISYCDRISLDAIHMLLKRSENLQQLSGSGVPSLLRRIGVERFSDPAPHNMVPEQKPGFRQFSGENIYKLGAFLTKEEKRRRDCEAQNIGFTPRADDSTELY
jgi:F-box and leucine-rich repeat protein GRR1